MDTRPIPRPRPTVEEQIQQYRAVVNNLFAHHGRVCHQSERYACSCGGNWPCAAEQLAAQLLDWV